MVYGSIEFPLFEHKQVQAIDLAASLLSWLAYMEEVLNVHIIFKGKTHISNLISIDLG